MVLRRISATSVTLGAGVETAALNSSSKVDGSVNPGDEEGVDERSGESGGEGEEEEREEVGEGREGEGKKTS